MPGNRGKQAAAAGAAVLAVGAGGVAAIRSTGDDVVRGVSRVDDVPTYRPPTRDPVPPTGGQGELAATDDLASQSRDDIAEDVICFAYETAYDETTGELSLPSEDVFVAAVGAQLAPEGSQLVYRLKAQSLYDALTEADPVAVAQSLAC